MEVRVRGFTFVKQWHWKPKLYISGPMPTDYDPAACNRIVAVKWLCMMYSWWILDAWF